MPVGIFDLDEVRHLAFKTFFPAAGTPIDVVGSELLLPLGKCVEPADIKANIVKHRNGSGARGYAVLIAVGPHIGHSSVRRVGGRESKRITGKLRKSFAV